MYVKLYLLNFELTNYLIIASNSFDSALILFANSLASFLVENAMIFPSIGL